MCRALIGLNTTVCAASSRPGTVVCLLLLALCCTGGLQAETVSATMDTDIVENASHNGPDNPRGSLTSMGLQVSTNWGLTPLMAFDLSAYSGRTVTGDGLLSLYLSGGRSSGASLTIGLHASTAAWDESTVTWNNIAGGSPFGSHNTTALDTREIKYDTTTYTPRWVTFTVPASQIQDWIDNPANNRGLLLKCLTVDGGWHWYRTKEYNGGSHAPRLSFHTNVSTAASVVSRTTVDSDQDGQIDAIQVQFDRPIRDDHLDSTQFAVNGYAVSGITSSTSNDATVSVNLTESGVADTGALPQVSITQKIIGEVGSITINQPDSSTWHTLTFTQSYTTPIVVFGGLTSNDAEAAHVRVKDVTASGCLYQIDECQYLDGAHGSETLSYMVLESGTHQLGHLQIEAGSISPVNQNEISHNFSRSFSSLTPAVLSQVVTYVGSAWVGTRLSNISQSGFDLHLDEEEGQDGFHADETVHYIAIDSGRVSTGGRRMQAGLTANVVTDSYQAVSFSETLTNPIVLGLVQTNDGSDPVTTRVRNISSSGFEVAVAEEQSHDTETEHADEIIGFIAFAGAGPIAIDITSFGGDGIPLDSAGTAATDGAAPVLIRATGSNGTSAVQARFSEAVWSDSGGSQPLTAADFAYGDVAAGNASSLIGISEADGSDRQVTLTTNANLGGSDVGSDTVSVQTNAIYDAAALAAVGSVTIAANDPDADAGGPYTINEGQNLTLDGSGSTGTSLSYAWNIDADGVFDDASGSGPTVSWATLAAAGLRTDGSTNSISLEVTNGSSDTDTASASLQLNNLAPTANAGGPYAIAEGSALNLDASASSDPGGDSLSYAWDLDNDGSYDDATGQQPALTWSMVQALALSSDGSSHTIGLRVTDADGAAASTTSTLSITNVAPSLRTQHSLVNPLDHTSLGTLALTSGASITIDTNALSITGSFTGTGTTVTSGDGLVQMAVFCFDSIDLPSGVTVTVTGDRALVLASRSTTSIGTTINLDGGAGQDSTGSGAGGAGAPGAAGSTNVPPPANAGNGGAGQTSSSNEDGQGPGGGGRGLGSKAGAGGAGYAGLGGDGSARSGSPGVNGVTYGDKTLTTLYGGSGGGGGSDGNTSNHAGGGGGGGAMQLSALTSITITGTLTADGGAGGSDTSSGGGGSGGAFLLAAPLVTVSGLVSVLGGAGGNGAQDRAGGGGGGGRIAVYSPATISGPDANYTVDGGDMGSASSGTNEAEDGQAGIFYDGWDPQFLIAINEGQDLTVARDWISDEDNTFSVDWDLDNDGLYDEASTAGTTLAWATILAAGLPNDGTIVTIGLRYTDDGGASITRSQAIQINNLAPIAADGGTYAANEGSPLTLDATGSSDPGGDSVSYAWDLDNDGLYDDATGSAPTISWASLTSLGYASNGSSNTITLRVTDSEGASTTDATTITINNLAPSAAHGGSYAIDAGNNLTVDATGSSDPGGDGLSYAWDIDNDGLYDDASGANPTISWATIAGFGLPDDGSAQTIRVRVTDADGAASIATTSLAITERDPPSLSSATTIDTDADGQVDTLRLLFSEAMTDSTFEIDDFTITGRTITGISSGATANDATLDLLITESGTADSGVVLQLHYAKDGATDATDRNANELAAFSSVNSADGVAPVLVSVSGQTTSSTLILTFSEAVGTDGAGGGSLLLADFTYADNASGSASALAAVVDGDASDSSCELQLDAAPNLTDIGTDGITTQAGAITDAAGNAIAAMTIIMSNGDATPPSITLVQTKDQDADGRIDGMTITFSEPMQDATILSSDFTTSSHTVTGWSTGTTADDAVIELQLTEAGTSDGQATPQLTYTNNGGTDAADLNGNELATTNITATDAVAPVLLDVVGTATSDRLQCYFSEPVGTNGSGGGDLLTSDFAYVNNQAGGSTALIAVTEGDGSDAIIELQTDAPPQLTDFANDAMQSLAGAITDSAGNAIALKSVNLRLGDTTPPSLSSATTLDRDDDGRIDGIHLVFTEDIEDSSVSITDFSVSGYTITAVDSDASSNDQTIILLLTEASTTDTEVRPNLSYTSNASQDLSDRNGNLLANITAYSCSDGAPPIITSISGDAAKDILTIVFSEAVSASASSMQIVAADDWSYIDGNGTGASTVTAMAEADGSDGILQVRVSGMPIRDDFDQDRLAAAATSLFDSSGNAVLTTARSMTNTDATPPLLIARRTRDVDANGQIDGIVLTFNEAIRDSSVSHLRFVVSNYQCTGIDTGSGADDQECILLLQESGLPDTGVRPTVLYTPGALVDLSNNPLAADSAAVLSSDGAAPVLYSATGTLGSTGVVLGFSEAITQAGDTALGTAAFQYNDSNTAGATAITASVDSEVGDAQVILTLDSALTTTDIGSDTIAAQSIITDLVGNTAMTTAKSISAAVTNSERPRIISDPPFSATRGLAWNYSVKLDLSRVPGASQPGAIAPYKLDFSLLEAPAGMTITKLSDNEAQVSWPTPEGTSVVRAVIHVRDSISGTEDSQVLLLLIRQTPGLAN